MPLASSSGPHWIHDTCRRASEALGWRLEFHGPHAAVENSESVRRHSVWQSPLHDGQEIAGHLCLQSPVRSEEAVERDLAIRTADVIADLMSKLASAERRIESQGRDVSSLLELGRNAPLDEPLAESLDRILLTAARLGGFWSSAFFLIDPKARGLRLRATHNMPPEQIPETLRPLRNSPDAAALVGRKIVLTREDPRHAPWLPENCAVGVVVPVRTVDGPLGTLWCYDRRKLDVEPRRQDVLETVAAQLAARLERIALLKESAARQKLRDELQSASSHHNSQSPAVIPREWGLDVAVRSSSMAELSGDLCEIWPVGRERTLFAIGDAVGHSVPAAMIMSLARGSLRTLVGGVLENLDRTDQLLARVNQALCTVTRSEQFMTLLCGVIDRANMTLHYSNGGHPAPWLIRAGQATPLESHGLLLGVVPDADYQRSLVSLQAGDWLLTFTDGVTEARSLTSQHFGDAGVLDAFAAENWNSAGAAADAIWSRMIRHTGDRAGTDDRTLLVIRA